MASAQAVSKLYKPVRELVLGATDEASGSDFGLPSHQREVAEWIDKVAKRDIGSVEGLKDLDTQLTPKTYIVDNYFTAADVAVYGALHPVFSELQPAQYYSLPALTRYFDHIQNYPSVRKSADALSPSFSLVPIDIENAPKLERKADPPKEKKKKTTATEASAAPPAESGKASAAAGPPSESSAPAESSKVQKKEKKDKKEKKEAGEGGDKGKKKGGESAKAAADDSGEPVPSMIDMRVGHIVEVAKHPDADSLYVEQIDFGEETGPRTVVSGLVNYIPIEQMRDRYLVGICNLKPANMRGVKSFAMVLAATSKDGKEGGVELIEPPPNSKPGDRVYFEGPEFENATPLPQLNPKKKIFETIQPGFTTLETREAAWINPATKSIHKIRTANGVCVAPNFVGASLS